MMLSQVHSLTIALTMTILLTTLIQCTNSFGRPKIVASSGVKQLIHSIRQHSSSSSDVDSSRVATDVQYMRLALRHAQFAFREKEVPIGAILVDGNGTVLSSARNSVERTKDASAHAEMTCVRKAASLGDNWRLRDCTLYTTLEPCPMCMGALQAFRVQRVVFGARDPRLGAAGSFVDLTIAHPFHNLQVTGGVLEEESSTLLKRFFQIRRREASGSSTMDKEGD